MSESKATKKLSDPQRVEVVRQYQILDTPRLAIEAANVGTWIIDEATRVFIASARVKELFGYAPEQELSLEAALMQISDKYRDKVSAGIEDAFRLGKPYHQDFSVTGLHDRQLR
ncbi:MAG: PAS domain-containing protein, partial [Mucilaginibacter sp.]